MKKVVIVGAGNGGTVVANNLAKYDEVEVTVIEPSEYHYYQPGIVDVVMSFEKEDKIMRKVSEVLNPRAKLIQDRVIKVDIENRKVITQKGKEIEYEYLVLAPGVINKDIGLPHWHNLDGAIKLREQVNSFNGKKIVVGYFGIIKCPMAPFEFAFLLRQRFPKADITLINPVSQPPELQKPMAEKLGKRAKELNIEVIRGVKIKEVDKEKKMIYADDGQVFSYDLALIDTPIRVSDEFSNLTDQSGFIPVDKEKLNYKDYSDVFVVGDATNITLPPKTGAIAHFQAITVSSNIINDIRGYEKKTFDGKAMCAGYAGYNEGLFVYMDYKKSKAIGPSTLYNAAKRAFLNLYWYTLTGKIDFMLDLVSRYVSGGPTITTQ
ncbi:NAD(P)/FAD-dependent oxidoreductase [Sulfurisphaera tokodaii]|uniref:Oxidoreductase n=2 Tax=Sulfurisphaera tokodaii TaxID=111955 RepID=Q96YG0_SULTO|nr:FAD-dependent oxidoreductase [Sulfurisphaera tokodaii]BAB67317.1 putative oxidoreductase [Sulfurisphaera tokodaii str. 7]HII73054.1 FAD-dependent oxidoreductase [Sulfurisphaera tokodaii]